MTQAGERVEDSPLSPLAVLMQSMQRHWNLGGLEQASFDAREIAPYLHPRMAHSSAAKGFEQLTDQELDELCAASTNEKDERGVFP